MKRSMVVKLENLSVADLVELSAECICNGVKNITFYTKVGLINISAAWVRGFYSNTIYSDEGSLESMTCIVGYSRRTSYEVLKLEILHGLLKWGFWKAAKINNRYKTIGKAMKRFVEFYMPHDKKYESVEIAKALAIAKTGNRGLNFVTLSMKYYGDIETFKRNCERDNEKSVADIIDFASISKHLSSNKILFERNITQIMIMGILEEKISEVSNVEDADTDSIDTNFLRYFCNDKRIYKSMFDKKENE